MKTCPLKLRKKLLVMAKIQHNCNVSSTLIIGLMCGIQKVIYWYPIAGLFASLLCIGRKEGKKKGKIEKSSVTS